MAAQSLNRVLLRQKEEPLEFDQFNGNLNWERLCHFDNQTYLLEMDFGAYKR